MEITFAESDRSTLGIEWEVAIVDRQTGDLANVADVVLEALRGEDGSPLSRRRCHRPRRPRCHRCRW